MPGDPTISSRGLAKFFAAAAAEGISRDELVTRVGLDAAALADADGRVPLAAVHRLWEMALARSGRREAPLLGARMYTPADYALVGFLLQHRLTVADALASMTRFSRLWTDEPRFELSGARLRLTYRTRFAPSVGVWCTTEAAFAEILNGLKLVTAQEVRLERVSFAHPAPSDRRPFDDFFGVRVEFDARENEMVLAEACLAAPLLRADPQLAAFLEGLAAAALARYGHEDSLGARVVALLAKRLRDGVPSARELARALGLSERTLRRRLEAEGTGLRDLVDAARSELAREFIRDRRLPIAEVAYLLGFSEVSAFHRAFKRWTGMTPASMRASDRRP